MCTGAGTAAAGAVRPEDSLHAAKRAAGGGARDPGGGRPFGRH